MRNYRRLGDTFSDGIYPRDISGLNGNSHIAGIPRTIIWGICPSSCLLVHANGRPIFPSTKHQTTAHLTSSKGAIWLIWIFSIKEVLSGAPSAETAKREAGCGWGMPMIYGLWMNEDEWNVISFLPPLTGSKRNCQSGYFRVMVVGGGRTVLLTGHP